MWWESPRPPNDTTRTEQTGEARRSWGHVGVELPFFLKFYTTRRISLDVTFPEDPPSCDHGAGKGPCHSRSERRSSRDTETGSHSLKGCSRLRGRPWDSARHPGEPFPGLRDGTGRHSHRLPLENTSRLPSASRKGLWRDSQAATKREAGLGANHLFREMTQSCCGHKYILFH